MVAELPEGENPGILFQALFLRRLPADIKRRSALGRSFSPTYRRGLSQSFQARHLSPKKQLHSLAGNPTTLIWSDIRNTALKRAKRSLIKTTILVHADVNAKLSLAVDVSDSHVGEVMQQYQHGCWKPLAFFSRKLSKTQQRYSTFDRELLGAFLFIRPFRLLL